MAQFKAPKNDACLYLFTAEAHVLYVRIQSVIECLTRFFFTFNRQSRPSHFRSMDGHSHAVATPVAKTD
jgi:hypothetical protein